MFLTPLMPLKIQISEEKKCMIITLSGFLTIRYGNFKMLIFCLETDISKMLSNCSVSSTHNNPLNVMAKLLNMTNLEKII